MAQNTNEPWRVILFTDWIWSVERYLQIFGDAGHRIVCIVTSQKRSDFYIDIIKAVPRSVDVLVSNRPKRWPAMLAPLKPDLIVSTVFPWRITNEMIEVPRLGAVNAHPSLLPRYRGTMIPKWMAWNGETESGWTVHRMAETFDSGPILAQSRFPIGEDDDMPSIFANLGPSLVDAWKLAMPKIAAGDPGEPQDESQATYYAAMTPEMQIVDWDRNARDIHNQVRAMSGGMPPHGAIGTLDGKSYVIHKSQIVHDEISDASATPGTVLRSNEDSIVVQCGDGPLRILRWEPIAAPAS